jgi:hypothetical protein
MLLCGTVVLFAFVMIGVDHFRLTFVTSMSIFFTGLVLVLLALVVFAEGKYGGSDRKVIG